MSDEQRMFLGVCQSLNGVDLYVFIYLFLPGAILRYHPLVCAMQIQSDNTGRIQISGKFRPGIVFTACNLGAFE